MIHWNKIIWRQINCNLKLASPLFWKSVRNILNYPICFCKRKIPWNELVLKIMTPTFQAENSSEANLRTRRKCSKRYRNFIQLLRILPVTTLASLPFQFKSNSRKIEGSQVAAQHDSFLYISILLLLSPFPASMGASKNSF